MIKLRQIVFAGLGGLAIPLLVGYVPLAGCASTDDDDRRDEVLDGAPSAEAGDAGGARDAEPADAGHDATDASDAGDAGTEAGIRCTAGGWCPTKLPSTDAGTMSLVDVWANHDEAWAVTSSGLILHWKNDAWSIVFAAEVGLTGVRRDHEGTVWVIGKAGTILRHFAGAVDTEWSLVTPGTTMDFVAICEGPTDASSPQNLWIAGQQTILMHWNGQGAETPAWSFDGLGPIEIRGMWCSQDNVFAVGLDFTNNATALYYGTSGGPWTKLNDLPATQFARPYSAVWASSASDIWMANITKVVHGPGGEPPAWESYDVGDWFFTSPTDWDFWGTSSDDLWLVGRHGRIYHHDGTKLELSLTSLDGVLMTNNLHGISGASSDDLWIVGDDIALHRKTQ